MHKVNNRQIQAPDRFGGAFHEPGETVDLAGWEADEEGRADLARMEAVGDITRLATWTSPTDYVTHVILTAADLNAESSAEPKVEG